MPERDAGWFAERTARVSVCTVTKELGNGGEAVVRTVYGHLGQVRHRASLAEYRAERRAAKLGERLAAVRGSDWHHHCYHELVPI